LFDEPISSGGANANEISNLALLACSNVYIDTRTISLPVNNVGASRIGVHIGQWASGVTLRGPRIGPWGPNSGWSSRVPTQTIQIDAGATNTILDNVTTVPNTGGDVSDLGTNTIWRNVSMNNGPSVNTVGMKAGVPSDGDYSVPPPVGTQVLDTTDGKIYYRTAAATWKAATLA
jgi:hypothetical protein